MVLGQDIFTIMLRLAFDTMRSFAFWFYIMLQLELRDDEEGLLRMPVDVLCANLRGGKVCLTHCCLLMVACSCSFSLRFSLISLGKYNIMKFCSVWSKLLASALPTACSCRQIGQLYMRFRWALIKHLTQKTWPHSKRIGRQAIASQIH